MRAAARTLIKAIMTSRAARIGMCVYTYAWAQTNAQSIKYQLTDTATLSSDQFPIKTGGGLFHFSTRFI